MNGQAPVLLEQKIKQHDEVIDGLKRLYRETIAPLEVMAQFEQFHSPPLKPSDFETNPMILLLGQYSVGKTSFIEYLLGRAYPGQMIGPEPTTDRFVAVYYGEEDIVIPGNTASMQSQFPFRTLDKFGNNFLNRFNVSTTKSEFLKSITLIDTPGVLAGEHQRLGRAYNFVEVVKWFALRSDLVLVLFDAHKLDISDEFRSVIQALRGNEDKVRVVLNKADGMTTQNLMRVYGALLWSLSRVLDTPEVTRVYIGSFWNQPLKMSETKALFEKEMADLLKELGGLPRLSAQRRVNELVKRTKLLRAIAVLVSFLRSEMPMFGKDKKKQELLQMLPAIYSQLASKFVFSIGDFPPAQVMAQRLNDMDFMKFPKIDGKLVDGVSKALSDELPRHLQLLQPTDTSYVNPFELEAKHGVRWNIDEVSEEKYRSVFRQKTIGTPDGKLDGEVLRPILQKSGMSPQHLSELWKLSDIDRDGKFTFAEFVIAMHLLKLGKDAGGLPMSLPQQFVQMVQTRYRTAEYNTPMSSLANPNQPFVPPTTTSPSFFQPQQQVQSQQQGGQPQQQQYQQQPQYQQQQQQQYQQLQQQYQQQQQNQGGGGGALPPTQTPGFSFGGGQLPAVVGPPPSGPPPSAYNTTNANSSSNNNNNFFAPPPQQQPPPPQHAPPQQQQQQSWGGMPQQQQSQQSFFQNPGFSAPPPPPNRLAPALPVVSNTSYTPQNVNSSGGGFAGGGDGGGGGFSGGDFALSSANSGSSGDTFDWL